MLVARIQNATRVLGAPQDWERDRNGVCIGLPVRDITTTAGPAMESAWFPTPEELAAIAAGAPIVLTVLGRGHPPVSISVGDAPKE